MTRNKSRTPAETAAEVLNTKTNVKRNKDVPVQEGEAIGPTLEPYERLPPSPWGIHYTTTTTTTTPTTNTLTCTSTFLMLNEDVGKVSQKKKNVPRIQTFGDPAVEGEPTTPLLPPLYL